MKHKIQSSGIKLDNALSAELKRVATDLIRNQEPLGEEFKKVYNNNRWNMSDNDDKRNK